MTAVCQHRRRSSDLEILWKSAACISWKNFLLFESRSLSDIVDRLFASIEPSLPDNGYFPPFAKDKLQWAGSERRGGRLAVIILESIDHTNLGELDLMASGRINGKLKLVVAKRRFVRFIDEEIGGHVFAVSTRIKHDFLLGVITKWFTCNISSLTDLAHARLGWSKSLERGVR